MKKIITAVIVIIIIATAGTAYLLLSQNKKETLGNTGDFPKSNQSKINENLNSNKESNGPYVGEDFTIISPPGWIQSHMPSTLVSFHNPDENHPKGSAAEKINFKSYMAVSFDNAQGKKLEEIIETTKQQIQGVASSVSFDSETAGTIDNQPVKFIEASLNQQNVDFKVLMAIVTKDEKYFTISANTTSEKWMSYRDTFYNTINSFKFK
jgi:hypothetical protein